MGFREKRRRQGKGLRPREKKRRGGSGLGFVNELNRIVNLLLKRVVRL